MRKLIFTLHLYTALIAGVFVTILGVTGAIMAFEPEIDDLFHAKLVYVTPGPHLLSLAELQGKILQAFPGERVQGYSLATEPNRSYQASLRRGTLYVNPYTGEVLGVRSGADGISTFLANVHQLHLRLLIRNRADSGKKVVSWAGVGMLFLLVTGLYLWWPAKRASIQWKGSARRFWFDFHNAVGIFSLIFLLLLSVTGILIGFDERAIPMFYQFTGSQPLRVPDFKVTPEPDAKPVTPDRAIEIARAALPGAAPFQINIPGPKGVYQIRSRFPEDLTPGGRSRVAIDQYSGQLLYAEGSRTAPAGRRMEIQNRAIHTGDVFGLPSKIVMSFASLMAPVQLVSGLVMWWKRRGSGRRPDRERTRARNASVPG